MMNQRKLGSLILLLLIFSPLVRADTLNTETPTGLTAPESQYSVYWDETGTRWDNYIGTPIIRTGYGEDTWGAVLFPNITISKNTLINSANLSLYFTYFVEPGENLLLSVYGIRYTFKDVEGTQQTLSVIDRTAPLTTKSKTVDVSGVTSNQYVEIGVTSIVQELINMYDWSLNDSIGFMILGANQDTPRTYQSNVGIYVPQLDIEYNVIPPSVDTFIQEYRNYTIWQEPNGSYTGTQYNVETGDSTWRVTPAINQHWLTSTDQDIMIFVYDDGTDKYSYYISDWSDLSDWDDPTEHGESFYTGAFAEKAGLSTWYHEVEDSIWLSGGYQSVGNNYERHTNVTIDSTLGYNSLWDVQIGSHGGNTMRSTSVMETPSGYRAVGYGSGTTSTYKYYTSPTDAVYTQSVQSLAVDYSAEVSVSYFGGLEPDIGFYSAFEEEVDQYDFRFRALNMSDNSAESGIVYMGYLERYTYSITPGALEDDSVYVTYYNSSSGWLECWEIETDGSYTQYMIDEVSPNGTVFVNSILDWGYNTTRIVSYVYDDNNIINAYNFHNGTWDTTPKGVTTISYDITSLMATPKGNNNVSGLLAEYSTGLIYIDVSDAFTGGFGRYYYKDANGTIYSTDCQTLECVIEEINDIFDAPPVDDPTPPGWDTEGAFTRSKWRFYIFCIGWGCFWLPLYYLAYAVKGVEKIIYVWIVLIMMVIALGLLWSLPYI